MKSPFRSPRSSLRMATAGGAEAAIRPLGLGSLDSIPMHILVAPDGRVRCVRAGALTVVGLLCGFIFAMSFVWAKGIDIECGCFGKGTKVGFRAVSEDVGMMLLALEAYAFDRGSFGLDGLIARLRRTTPA